MLPGAPPRCLLAQRAVLTSGVADPVADADLRTCGAGFTTPRPASALGADAGQQPLLRSDRLLCLLAQLRATCEVASRVVGRVDARREQVARIVDRQVGRELVAPARLPLLAILLDRKSVV